MEDRALGTGQRTRGDTSSRVAAGEGRYLTLRRQLIQRRLNQSACANTPSRVGEKGLRFLMTPQSQDLCFMSYRNYWGAGTGKSKQLRAHVHMKQDACLLQIAPHRHRPPPTWAKSISLRRCTQMLLLRNSELLFNAALCLLSSSL